MSKSPNNKNIEHPVILFIFNNNKLSDKRFRKIRPTINSTCRLPKRKVMDNPVCSVLSIAFLEKARVMLAREPFRLSLGALFWNKKSFFHQKIWFGANIISNKHRVLEESLSKNPRWFHDFKLDEQWKVTCLMFFNV